MQGQVKCRNSVRLHNITKDCAESTVYHYIYIYIPERASFREVFGTIIILPLRSLHCWSPATTYSCHLEEERTVQSYIDLIEAVIFFRHLLQGVSLEFNL
jgi:hypothetical protein